VYAKLLEKHLNKKNGQPPSVTLAWSCDVAQLVASLPSSRELVPGFPLFKKLICTRWSHRTCV